jgi:hypothetical protein
MTDYEIPPVVASAFTVEPREYIRGQIQALTASANKSVLPGRKVDVYDVYQALDRVMDKTVQIFQEPEKREIIVMREISDFLKVATTGTEPKFCHDYLDLLPVGHPLSTKDMAELSYEDLAEHKVLWLSADPEITETFRPLVASAYRSEVGSVERKYLVARLESLPSSDIPRKTVVSLLEHTNNDH